MRRTALAAGGAALAIALAGCGGGGNGGNAIAGDPQPLFGSTQELVQAASSEASSAKSTKMTMTMTIGERTINADGAIQFAGKNSAMRMTMDVMGKTIEIRLVDATVYIKKPAGAGGASAKPWVKKSIANSGMLSQFGKRADPTKLLERIQRAGTITKSEKTKLNGRSVSHYWLQLDFSKMAEMSPMAQQLPPNMMSNMKNVTLPMQLWMNSDNLPVKVTMDMSKMMKSMFKAMKDQMPSGANSGAFMSKMKQMFKNMSITMTYSDWGEPVNVTAPPADKVTTASPSGQPGGSGSGFFGTMPN